MTAEPEVLIKNAPASPDFTYSVLQDVFALGYARSQERVLLKDEAANLSVRVVYRTLIPAEVRDIYEVIGKYNSVLGQLITEQIETLARSVESINGMALQLPRNDCMQLAQELKVESPSPLQQARYVLTHKVKSAHLLDTIWVGYKDFVTEVDAQFEEIKKKSQNPASLPST